MKQKAGWAEAIQRAFASEAEEVPPGWMTLNQVAAELGKNKYHACKLLNKMIRMGKAETRKFRTWIKDSRDARGPRGGYLRQNRHYRLVTPAARKGAGIGNGRASRA